MRKAWLINLQVWAVATLVFGSQVAASERVIRYEDGAGGQMWYRLILPENYDPSVSYPLTLFLHGNSGTNIRPVVNPDTDVERPPPGLRGALSSGPYESILVAPQLERGIWASNDNDRLIREALADVEATYGTDPQRRYVTGLSFGGYGTFHFLQAYPDDFAAGAALAGFYFPFFRPGDPVPQDPYADYAQVVKDIPLWVFHGTVDGVVRVEESRAVVDALLDIGGNVRYSELPDGQHDIWTPLYDVNNFPPTAIMTLDVDTTSNSFQVWVDLEQGTSQGINEVAFNLQGVESIRNLLPKSDFSPATGTSLGFDEFRSLDDAVPVTGWQTRNATDPTLIGGFGQVAGILPGAGTGDGEVQAEYGAPLLVAEGTYSDLSQLDFTLEQFRARTRLPTVSVIRNDGQRMVGAINHFRVVHDGEEIYTVGDHEELYPWLFRQQLIPEPSTVAMLMIGFVMACGSARRQS